MVGIDLGKDSHDQEAISSNEVIGEVIIGLTDPRGIDAESFSKKQELLFHGATEDFIFRRDFDYAKDGGIHSHTVGEGFYTTPSRADAVLFSEAFGAGERPVVIEILPYMAKMYDFRTRNLEDNGGISRDMLERYFDYYKNLYKSRWDGYVAEQDRLFIQEHATNEPDEDLRSNATTFGDMFAVKKTPFTEEVSQRSSKLSSFMHATNYLNILDYLRKRKDKIDLREMLSLSGEARVSEYASRLFRDFMLSDGFDGVVYIEGGDHPEHKKPVSCVFFNLEKIGTYQVWNSEVHNTKDNNIDGQEYGEELPLNQLKKIVENCAEKLAKESDYADIVIKLTSGEVLEYAHGMGWNIEEGITIESASFPGEYERADALEKHYFLKSVVSGNHVSSNEDFLRGDKYINLAYIAPFTDPNFLENPKNPFDRNITYDVNHIRKLAKENCLVLLEEWSHVLQHESNSFLSKKYRGNTFLDPTLDQDMSEWDVAAYFVEKGINISGTAFEKRYHRKDQG